MLKFILLSVLLSVLLQTGYCDDKFTGPGLWHLKTVQKCPEDAAMPIKIDCVRRKINRTHDGIDVKLKLDEIIDKTFAFRSEICKVVDGGCKPYQILSEPSLAQFVFKYAEENVKKFFTLAKIEPQDFPINPGNYELKNFVMNYEELPEDGPYGDYIAVTFILKDGLEKACVELHLSFQEKD